VRYYFFKILFFTILFILSSLGKNLDAEVFIIVKEFTAFKAPGLNPKGIAWMIPDLINLNRKVGIFTYPLFVSLKENGSIKSTKPLLMPYYESIVFDGRYLWMVDLDRDSDYGALIYKINLEGEIVLCFPAPGPKPTGLAWDGRYLWNADSEFLKLYKMNPENGRIIETYPCPGEDPRGIVWDGKNMWIADPKAQTIYRYCPANGRIIKTKNYPGISPYGLSWKDGYLWCSDYSNGKIYRLKMILN
jgi:hypothetical protein